MESSIVVGGNKYRDYLSDEEVKNTKWRNGPPSYDDVDKLFEQERTHVWAEGSIEEKVQRLLKTWEMELVHKIDPNDMKSVDPTKFKKSVNGRKALTPEEAVKLGGGYNIFLQTSLPENLRVYNPDEETFESSQNVFRSIFKRGFAIEVLHVYSGPPEIVYKFRHWGYMEGPFKGYAPTGQLVELFGIGIFEVWAEGSVEEKVQRLLKTWEMEIVHKADPNDLKTMDPNKFTISINGRKGLTPAESAKLGGSYNIFLQTSLPKDVRLYDPDEETFESSQKLFRSIFLRGFAIEILHVYSGPPEIVYKFRHWGYMDGPFKGHAPTGQLVEIFGIGTFELDKESNKIIKAEMFLDRGELLGGLVKGESNSDQSTLDVSKCPFMK